LLEFQTFFALQNSAKIIKFPGKKRCVAVFEITYFSD